MTRSRCAYRHFPKATYTGMIAENIISSQPLLIPRTRYVEGVLSISLDIKAGGGIMTLQDLQDYEAIR